MGTPTNPVGDVGIPAMPGKRQQGRRACHQALGGSGDWGEGVYLFMKYRKV